MSVIESYSRQQSDLARKIDAKRIESGIFIKSPVSAFAQIMIQDVKSEIVRMDRGNFSRYGSTILEQTKEDKRRGYNLKNLESLLLFGNTLLIIEEIIRDGVYNHYVFTRRINLDLGNVAKKIPEGTNVDVFYEKEKYKKLVRIAISDPSLSGVLENSEELLPEDLVIILQTVITPENMRIMTTQYKKLMNDILKNAVNPKKEKIEQGAFLTGVDMLIKRLETKKNNIIS